MKIVIFGPERRLGALIDDRVIDLNHGFARYLHERGDRSPNEQAAERLPADLKSFIEGGAVALENAQRVINHLAGIDCDNDGELSKVVHSRSRGQASCSLAGAPHRLRRRQLRRSSFGHVGQPARQDRHYD